MRRQHPLPSAPRQKSYMRPPPPGRQKKCILPFFSLFHGLDRLNIAHQPVSAILAHVIVGVDQVAEFCLLSNKELLNPASERRNWAEVFKNAPIIYQSQAYTAYSFKNYAEMLGLASEYSFDLGNTDYYSEGNITQNRTAKRILGPGASSLGPLITMYPGRYKITCRGQNLDILTFDTVSERTGGPRMKIIGKEKVTKTPELIEYTIDISETLTQVETIFFNGSQGTAVMESLDIKKAD